MGPMKVFATHTTTGLEVEVLALREKFGDPELLVRFPSGFTTHWRRTAFTNIEHRAD